MPKAVPTHRPPQFKGASAARHRTYDRTRRDREAKAFYHTQAWLKLRLIKLGETPFCEDCMDRDSLVRATIVHHVLELRDAWDERLSMENLRSLCQSCHSRLHRRQADDE